MLSTFMYSLCVKLIFECFWQAALLRFFSLWNQDKLQKEEKNSAVNLLKLNEGWRTILRQTQPAELRKDAVVLRQTFEKQLDGMDDVIKVSSYHDWWQLTLRMLPLVCLFCSFWRVTYGTRNVSRLRCGVFTCSMSSVCGLSRKNGWHFCRSTGRRTCSTWAPGSTLRGKSEEPQFPLQR